MKYLRRLLFPFSLLYGLVVMVRNWCYDSGFFKSTKFNFPVISIGNLEVGGAGKSPMTEYLIRKFKNDYRVATLSRGYGRVTKGFLIAGSENQESRSKSQGSEAERSLPITTVHSPFTTHNSLLSSRIGDEPAQFKQKFPDITVAVCENRVRGLKELEPDHDLVLMDDAYQHRAVEPGLSILLFDFNKLTEPHLLLPAGNLREPFSGRWRAQVLIISKCPAGLTSAQMGALAGIVAPLPYQQLFFTSIGYLPLQQLNGLKADVIIDEDTTVFLLTGIANAGPLVQYLAEKTSHIVHHNYPDHHTFTLKNISKLALEYSNCKAQKKLIVTTEKDAQRLDLSWLKQTLPGFDQLPVFVVPINVEFLNNDGPRFDQIVTEYVREHTTSHRIH